MRGPSIGSFLSVITKKNFNTLTLVKTQPQITYGSGYLDKGVRTDEPDGGSIVGGPPSSSSSSSPTSARGPGGPGQQLPSMSDMLVCYPTLTGYYAWRNRARGSWYIEAIVQVFMRYAKCEDICAMLNRILPTPSKAVTAIPSSPPRQTTPPLPPTPPIAAPFPSLPSSLSNHSLSNHSTAFIITTNCCSVSIITVLSVKTLHRFHQHHQLLLRFHHYRPLCQTTPPLSSSSPIAAPFPSLPSSLSNHSTGSTNITYCCSDSIITVLYVKPLHRFHQHHQLLLRFHHYRPLCQNTSPVPPTPPIAAPIPSSLSSMLNHSTASTNTIDYCSVSIITILTVKPLHRFHQHHQLLLRFHHYRPLCQNTPPVPPTPSITAPFPSSPSSLSNHSTASTNTTYCCSVPVITSILHEHQKESSGKSTDVLV
ncbi:LOW QUALITY PROTEIN: caspase-2 [Plakobranchus ocellatus]|uniref:Caspase-2 n=1 Tax=Plakobranchus ocellatus TaxID=259542 RepID=A0AAV4CG65_9GAST|nr:LOW QUALITY PROTEIN: caspase-2 [Plakobranchus ocellatus]